VFDAGNYQRTGYSAAMTQGLGENSDFTVAVGRSGALLAGLKSQPDADALRGSIHASQRTWMTARVTRSIRKTGTRVVSSYGWTDFNALMPEHISMTDPNGANQESGLNVFVRQPLPLFSSLFGTFGRFEATAELRNLLAQGYLPVVVNDQRAILTNSPRAVRGGLSFIF
jgi:hypothetical protein